MGKWAKTITILLVLAFITHSQWVPFSSFFRNVDTMIHEFGHAMVTLMLSGTVMNIDLYADHSGVTRSLVSNRAAMIPIGLSGYATASLFAWGLFSLYARRRQTLGLLLIMGVAVGSLLLFVRNGFGMAWLAGFIVLTAVVLLLAPKTVVKYYYLFIAFLTLEESVTGSVTILLAAYLHPGQAGDASVLANVSPVPAIVWGAGFLVFSLWCAKQAVTAFAGRRKETRQTGRFNY